MKDTLLLLQELQAIDARVLELRGSMAALPEKLRPAKQDLGRLEEMLAQEKAQLADTEAWRKEQEELVRREEDGVKHARAKLQASKNAKDFAAASREVDNKRKSIAEREEEILKVIEPLEATRANIAAHEKDVEELRSKIEEQERAILSKVEELQKEAETHSSGRDEKASKIERTLLKRYELVLSRRGIAVVPVKDGVCGGCHMALPPQLNNVLARFETIESCPNCQRLLYRVELLEQNAGGE